MRIPSYLKRLTARRLWNVVRFAVVIPRRRITMKRLQKMAVDLHMKYFEEEKFMDVNSVGGNFNDHYQFSCSSSPSTNSCIYGHGVNKVRGGNNVYGRFLLRALLPSCTCLNVKDELDSESGFVGIPHFISCDEDNDQSFNYMDSCTHVSTTKCPNCCFSSEIDRQAEEFIATFYQQMSLQHQESCGK